MATVLLGGPRTWSGERDAEGYRTYKISHLIEGTTSDGPANAMQTPGLPIPGSIWFFGDDIDPWVWCRPDASVQTHQGREGSPNRFWLVEQTFSNKPLDSKKCSEDKIEDPLLERPKVSGGARSYTEECIRDRFGRPIVNSSHELLRGKQVEFTYHTQTIKIEQNVATPTQGYILPGQMLDTVNYYPLWGYPRRCVMLADATWDLLYHGSCYSYYKRILQFECYLRLNQQTGVWGSGWDRDLLDEGQKVLNGHWDTDGNWTLDTIGGVEPSPGKPHHFIRATDRVGNPIRVILDGLGKPVAAKTSGVITGVTAAAPVLVNSAAHGLVTGDYVAVSDVEAAIGYSDAEINGVWQVSVFTDDLFELDGCDPDDFVYDSGGVWTLLSRGPGNVHVERYRESDFVQLGIPLIF